MRATQAGRCLALAAVYAAAALALSGTGPVHAGLEAVTNWRGGMVPVAIAARDSALHGFLYDHIEGDGRVRYDLVRVRSRHRLDDIITSLATTDTTDWPATRRMGLQIDLYNLVMIRAVVDRWKPGWTPAADGFAVFKAPLVPTRGGAISLDELEKKRTVTAFKDPRVHVAFNCGARSCPPLVVRSWKIYAEWLGEQMDRQMRAFLADTTRNQVDHTRRVLRLSRIFDWYAADFGGRAGVLKTVSRYLGRDVTGYRVEFLEYDWSLNAATFPDGSRPR